jgi:hypothetical protein
MRLFSQLSSMVLIVATSTFSFGQVAITWDQLPGGNGNYPSGSLVPAQGGQPAFKAITAQATGNNPQGSTVIDCTLVVLCQLPAGQQGPPQQLEFPGVAGAARVAFSCSCSPDVTGTGDVYMFDRTHTHICTFKVLVKNLATGAQTWEMTTPSGTCGPV